jgi:hypothetical protein
MQFGSDVTPDDLKGPWGNAKNTLHWLAVRAMRMAVSYKPWLPLWQTYAAKAGRRCIAAAAAAAAAVHALGADTLQT